MDDHTRAPPRVRSHGCSDYPLGFRFTPATIAVSYQHRDQLRRRVVATTVHVCVHV